MIEANELIVVKQLPIIEQQLRGLKTEIETEVELAKSLVCTEDTVKDIKKTRAELNSKSKELEAKRIEIKNAIMGPYNDFEKIFKECVTTPLLSADKDLKNKIDEVENTVKAEKEQEVKAYFDEYITSKEIGFLKYENVGINVTLSASTKKLKEQVKDFVNRVCDDLTLIETQEHKSEILVEYKKNLNCSLAITTVASRIKAIEEQKKADEEATERRKEQAQKDAERIAEIERIKAQQAVTAPEPISPPEPINQPEQAPPQKLRMTFTVTGTIEELKEIKAFLVNGGYKYE